MSEAPITKRGRGRPPEGRGGVQVTILLYPRDIEMAEELAEHFGSSRSDAIRTAVRTLHVTVVRGKSNA